MDCIRCRKQAGQLIALLGVTEADALVERWRCAFCKKVFLVEYQQNGDICWIDGEYQWAPIPKGKK